MKTRQRLIAWNAVCGLLILYGLAPPYQLLEIEPAFSSHPGTQKVMAPAKAKGPILSSTSPVLSPSPSSPSYSQTPGSSRTPVNENLTGDIFAEFSTWLEQYQALTSESPRQLAEPEGCRLARKRQAAMEQLIQFDPRSALELSITVQARKALPPSVRMFLETPIEGHGDIRVLAALPYPGEEARVRPLSREVRIKEDRYQAFVYGRRSGEPSRINVPLRGIVLGKLMAVADYPAGSGEADPVARAASSPAVEMKLLFIRVDFSDLGGNPFEEEAGMILVTNANQFYLDNSYGKAGFAMKGAGTDITPTFRMPHPASYYGGGDLADELRSDAREAASAAGYNLDQYDFDLICFSRITAWQWAGQGYVGETGVWINGAFTTGVVAHELGHNLGLGHASLWQTSDYSAIGAAGAVQEYGDKFDTMGDSVAGQKHFNARFKNLLNWLPNTNVAVISSNGIYTLSPHDSGQIHGIQALRIARNNRTNYWVEFRQKITGNRWLMAGVGLRWASSDSLSTLLLDSTPGSVEGIQDSAIVLGRTFSDYLAGIHITPLAILPTLPPSIQVAVNRGSFTSNHPPRLELVSSAEQLLPGVEATFEARGTDQDGDALAYAWDLGDGSFGANQATVTKRWLTAGLYLVRCSVSDMKGGVTTDSVLVRVGHPNLWTLSGRVLENGKPLAGIRVSASSSKVTWTGSDGRYILAGLADGSYNLVAGHDESLYLRPGFTNPVIVRTNLPGLDFLVPVPPVRTSFVFVPQGSTWKYLDTGESLATNWTRPDYDDTSWKEGAAPLGYSNPVATTIGYGPSASSKYMTAYFRRAFQADGFAPVLLDLWLLRDDGGIVYLNGREILRSNMPTGPVRSDTRASSTVSGTAESTFYHTELPSASVQPGTNLLAVEIHQASPSSSDLVFDLRLEGQSDWIYPVPRLSWKLAGNRLALAWPADVSGWKLQSALALDTAPAWSPDTPPPVYQDGLYRVELPVASPSQFFILNKSK